MSATFITDALVQSSVSSKLNQSALLPERLHDQLDHYCNTTDRRREVIVSESTSDHEKWQTGQLSSVVDGGQSGDATPFVTALLRCGVTDYLRDMQPVVCLDRDVAATISEFTVQTLERNSDVLHNHKNQLSSTSSFGFVRLVDHCRSTVEAATKFCDHTSSSVTCAGQNANNAVMRLLTEVEKAMRQLVKLWTDDELVIYAAAVLACVVVFCELHRFDSLMTSVCIDDDDDERRNLYLLLLDAVADVDCNLVDSTLELGDVPLVRAARWRRPDVIAMLLRHGCNVQLPPKVDLSLDAVDTMVFSPNYVAAVRREQDLEQCLRLLLSATPHPPLLRLSALSESGNYYPLCDNWYAVVVRQMSLAWNQIDVSTCLCPVTPLFQLSRCAVRRAVRRAVRVDDANCNGVVRRIERLPLPARLRQFLHLNV